MALNLLVCYFFFPGEVIFLFAYFILRYVLTCGRGVWRRFPQILLEGCLGCMIPCILMIPSFLNVLENPRFSSSFSGLDMLLYSPKQYLAVLKALIFPGEAVYDQSSVNFRNIYSCAAYLPMTGMVFVTAFMMMNRRHWLTRMLRWCLVMACVPVLNAAFALFTDQYCRWYYMPILLFSLCGAIVSGQLCTESADTDKSSGRAAAAVLKSARFWLVVLLLFIAFLGAVWLLSGKRSLIYHKGAFAVLSLISLAGILLTGFAVKISAGKRMKYLVAGIFIFAVLTHEGTFVRYLWISGDYGQTTASLADQIEAGKEMDLGEGYRWMNRNNEELLPYGIQGSCTFISTVSGSIFRFFDALGQVRSTNAPRGRAGVFNLLSTRYYYSTSEQTNDDCRLIRTFTSGSLTYYIYEMRNVPPIGFTYDTYMTASEFAETDEETRCVLMMKTLVVPDDRAGEVSGILEHYDPRIHGAASEDLLDEISAAHIEESSKDISRTTDSFASTIVSRGDKYAFFSIPDDPGWSAFVNGNDAEIIDINGFMAVRIQDGENRVEFHYTVPGLRLGKCLSLTGLLLSLLYAFCFRRCGGAPVLRHTPPERQSASMGGEAIKFLCRPSGFYIMITVTQSAFQPHVMSCRPGRTAAISGIFSERRASP